MNETVTVAGGTPTLTLNDGGTATYVSGSGTNALTFSYTVAPGRTPPRLRPPRSISTPRPISDGAGNAASLSLTGLTQSGPQIDTTTPTISSLTTRDRHHRSGDLGAGKTVTLTLTMSEVVTVTAARPTLTLNDGGTATYVSGSGTNALTFSYTVAAGQSTSALAATAVNLNTATISDGAGNAASLSLTGLTQSGPQIDTTTPRLLVWQSRPASGDLNAGKVVTVTLDMSEVVTVNTTGGTPTLTLNDGGTATYTGGSGTNALTFSYTVLAGQNTPDLMETAVNLNGATIQDGAGNAANLSLAGLPQGSPQIDTTAPTISSLDQITCKRRPQCRQTVTLTLTLSEAVTVAGGTPTLTLNDGGIATYAGGSGTNALTFSYTVGAGQNTSALAATAVNLNSATVTDGAGNAANLSLIGLTQTGPQIDTTTPPAPTITSFSPNGGTASGGYTNAQTLTLNGNAQANSTVEVFDGSKELGTANVNGSGTWTFTTPTLSNGIQNFTAQDVDAAGNVSAASTALTETLVTSANVTKVGTNFVVSAAASDPVLQMGGTPVVASQLGNWTAIGAVQTASGYDIAWHLAGTNTYTVWTTDPNANYTGNIGAVSGNSYTLESMETIFQQDLNGDGAIGPTTTVIQTNGSTSLTEVANRYFYLVGSIGTGPELKYNGANVTSGEFGAWTPIGAVQTATGYDVAWKNSSTGAYTAWTTDSNGNYLNNLIGAVSGTSYALESIEPVFNQDLNSDGVVGPTTTLIQLDGSTKLTEVANEYFLYGSSNSGPALSYNGAPVVAGGLGNWTPIGAVQVANGYEVAFELAGTNLFTIWNTDINGNEVSDTIGAVTGTSLALESAESTFGQDFNGDGVIGLKPIVIATDTNAFGSTSLAQLGNEYFVYPTSGTPGPDLKINGTDVLAGILAAGRRLRRRRPPMDIRLL